VRTQRYSRLNSHKDCNFLSIQSACTSFEPRPSGLFPNLEGWVLLYISRVVSHLKLSIRYSISVSYFIQHLIDTFKVGFTNIKFCIDAYSEKSHASKVIVTTHRPPPIRSEMFRMFINKRSKSNMNGAVPGPVLDLPITIPEFWRSIWVGYVSPS